MAKRDAATAATKKPAKVLVQLRVSAEEHAAFSTLCSMFSQSKAARLATLIRRELESCYPHLRVTAGAGGVAVTRAVMTGHTEPEMTEVNLIVPKANVTEPLRHAIMEGKNLRLEMPLRTPRAYGLASSFESSAGNYHLFLKELPQKS